MKICYGNFCRNSWKICQIKIYLYFIIINISRSINASVLPTALIIQTVLPTDIQIQNISRYNDGDIFIASRTTSSSNIFDGGGTTNSIRSGDSNNNSDDIIKCETDTTCVGISSGTAANKFDQANSCTCQCLSHLPAFRDDLHICVDDIHECPLAPFVSGSTSQRIPFVFLPLKGQIVHPSKEISLAGIHTPLCRVASSQFLTSGGWIDLRNPTDGDVPFRLFHDEGRTFLQWLGESELRTRMTGRLILVHMLCGDIGLHEFTGQNDIQQMVYTPCVAFRVVGSPVKYQNNVSEVVFSPDAQSSLYNTSAGLNSSEYIAIGICSVLLGLIYVASVFLYLHLRRRKDGKQRKPSSNSLISTTVGGLNGIIQAHRPHSVLGSGGGDNTSTIMEQSTTSDDVIVKNNPLLKMASSKHLSQSTVQSLGKHNMNSADGTDTINVDDEIESAVESGASDTDGLPDVLKNHGTDVLSTSSSGGERSFHRRSNNHMQVTSALIHPNRHERKFSNFSSCSSDSLQDNIERLPEENVSIIETTEGREDRLENIKPIVNNNTRRKLYFNPAYFEPHLLAAPPPAAIEFLQKIREVITIAKQKMATKRFTPSLMGIPEEDSSKSSTKDPIYDFYPTSLRNSNVSLKRENNRRQTQPTNSCANCDITDYFKTNELVSNKLSDLASLPKCKSCTLTAYENKKRSIRKWLEDVPVLKSPVSSVRSEDPRILNSYINEKLKASFDKITIPERSLSFYSESKHRIKPKLPTRLNPPSATDRYKKVPPPITPQNLSPHPDMINEAIAVDNNKTQNFKRPATKNESKEKMAAVINEFAVLVKPHVNGETAREHRNASDYETDSLERLNKRTRGTTNGFHTPSDYGEVSSSQPSPSLSNALPLDEEMTMRNAILTKNLPPRVQSQQNGHAEHEYEIVDKKNNMYKLPELLNRDDCYSLVSEVYVNNGYNYDSSPSSPSDSECSSSESTHNRLPKIRYTEPEKPGHLLIEVEDCANNYIRVEDSDQFEPDTFDRKSSKRKSKRANPKGKESVQDSLERPGQILLRSSGSFKSVNQTNGLQNDPLSNYFNRNFGSLREIYEAKARMRSAAQPDGPNSLGSDSLSWKCDGVEEGRILTLEERHSRRQRKSTPPNTTNKSAPPDVIPPSPPQSSPIYQHPPPPKKVFNNNKLELPSKNGVGRGTMKSMDTIINHESASPSVSLPSTLSGTSVNSSNHSSDYYRHKGEDFLQSNITLCNHTNTKLLENFSTNKFTNSINHSTQFILKKTLAKNSENIKLFQRKLESDVLLNDMCKDSGNVELTKHICDKENQNLKRTWRKIVSLKSPKPEDSGYLSTDSNEDKKYKMNNIDDKDVDKDDEHDNLESVSETEDGESLGDGHSESGAESIETHSVFFDSFRQKHVLMPVGSTDSGVSCNNWIKSSQIVPQQSTTMRNFTDNFTENNQEINFVTVLPLTHARMKMEQ